MALIEKGVDVSDIYAKRGEAFRFPWLKIGIIITGISVGVSIILVFWLQKASFTSRTGGLGLLMLISGILFGGISMIIAYLVDKPVNKK